MTLMHINKNYFEIDSYTLESGKSIPVKLGYETYGTLNKEKDNVVLVPHYFSASSHAAGKYSEDDKAVGYWDGLIGPDKAIDTNKYFVISTDNLCNVHVNDPNIITTGPRTINPETGKMWGMDFPAFTFRDVAGIQKEFIVDQLGIPSLHAIMGASAGGFVALSWAVEYPELVKNVIGVITNPQNPILTSFTVLQHAMRAIALDPNWNEGNYDEYNQPKEGLALAIQMMNAGAFTASFYEKAYPRVSDEEKPYLDINIPTSYEETLGNAIAGGMGTIDASHWYYTCRATMMHDIAHHHGTLEEALKRIQANTLMVSCRQDYLQPTEFNQNMVDILSQLNKTAELFEFDSDKGHMGGIFDTHLFAEKISKFIN